MSSSENEQRENRRAKLAALRARAIDPFPCRFTRSHRAAEIQAGFERLAADKTVVRAAGRLVARREHGKTWFGLLEDGSGRVQLYFRRDTLGDQFAVLELTDLGDFIGVAGEVFRTRTGEVTIQVAELTVLAKALLPLPEKWHGLRDVETRFRQRYLDLVANPAARRIFETRTVLLRLLRRFFDERGFLEVESPVLQPIYGGASARPFETHYAALDQRMFLRIADELYLKRLIVGGLERVYEIGKDFRNEGLDRFHNPEFTQLEAYWSYADYEEMMALVEDCLRFLARELTGGTTVLYGTATVDFGPAWTRLAYVDELARRTGDDRILERSPAELAALCTRHGIDVQPDTPVGKLLDKLFTELVQKRIIQPTFVVDQPRLISPLAKAHRRDPRLVERFEPVICGIEFGNAFSELNDPEEQRRRFEEQIRAREEFATLDEDFLTALEHGMPPCAGLGLGVDRLVMLFANVDSIREVILFPQLRNEPHV